MIGGTALAHLVVLLGGDAGLRCGEIMALEWKDVDLQKRQLCIARSDWKGHVTATKGGRIRYVPLTVRLAEALKRACHLRGVRVASGSEGEPLTQKVVQGLLRRAARRAHVKEGVHIRGTRFARTSPCVGRRLERSRSSQVIRTWPRRSATCT